MTSPQEPLRGQGVCPCCDAHLAVDPRQRFGIIACPECERIIWWVLPSEPGAELFFSDDLKRRLEDIGTDSFDTIELVMSLEEHLGHEIPDEDAEKIETVEDLVRYIKPKTSGPLCDSRLIFRNNL